MWLISVKESKKINSIELILIRIDDTTICLKHFYIEMILKNKSLIGGISFMGGKVED